MGPDSTRKTRETPTSGAAGDVTELYRHPALTVDGVVLLHQADGALGDQYSVLLIERGRDATLEQLPHIKRLLAQ